MCTVITKNMKPRPRIAKEDIPVYKYSQNLGDGNFHSNFKNFHYRPEVTYTTVFSFSARELVSDSREALYLETILNSKRVFVVEGFHSFNRKSRSSSKDKALFIIPKGTKYYLNKAGNAVSESIIFKYFL